LSLARTVVPAPHPAVRVSGVLDIHETRTSVDVESHEGVSEMEMAIDSITAFLSTDVSVPVTMFTL
jgi:hypothetical protein